MSRLLTRRSALIGSLALAGAATLAACGGSSSGGSGGSGDGNTLKVWCWDPAFNIYAMQEAEKVYKKDHPDFTLEITEMVWDDVQQKLTTLAQSQDFDQLPDIFLMQNMAGQKNIENFPDIFGDFSDSGIDFSEFPESVTNYFNYDGVQYGLPFDAGTAIGAWRTDVLDQAGYTIGDLTDISWSRFIEIGKDVKAKTGKPMLSSQAGASDLIMMMIQSAGSSLFNDDGSVHIADNDVLLKAVGIYKQLVDEGVLVEVNSWDEYIGSFTGEQVVGTIQGVWISGSIQTATEQSGKWAVTNVPAVDDVPGATNYTANGGSSWVISSNANAELAADFLKATFAGSTELYDTILPSSGAVANWLPAGESDVYNEPVEFYGGQAVYADVVSFSSKVPSVNTGVYYYEGRDAVSAAITQIVGGADPASALKDASDTTEFAMG
ncbi:MULTISPECIES: extracellular solute-binding protein [unclassified Actinomyces]|uniref:ABC transporter substrate-binding protein n=1 Tax=unclassified Actinomyces TaxID=2609248 RepID=UPI002017B9CC|nr:MULTISPECIES: extracellular solute-binding protein [unclassified Actinomyces]MCL3777112.1 extracellular solute-binding protein [Actinomyces sp. AC-20-1]MCL3788972.1 extracellular solute-binding protein [Actinomyces sp. 187325]MCL3791298.1 extracellular solute-binding protein [Actinomyces sp. 186855]MCL3795380.1 extracellular solute-binding protein [Actinomyces sp. 217892]